MDKEGFDVVVLKRKSPDINTIENLSNPKTAKTKPISTNCCCCCGDPKCTSEHCSLRNCTSSSVEIRLPYERLRHYLTRDGGGRRKLPCRETQPQPLPHQSYINNNNPNLVRIDDRQRRQLIATRDIAEGEVILRETPLIVAPSSKEFPTKSKTSKETKEKTLTGRNNSNESSNKFKCICLGCYKNVQSLYKCSKCGWPVCDKECEKV